METETRILHIDNFDALKNNSWSGALQTLEEIERLEKEDELVQLINDIIECNEIDGIFWTDTQLNDFLWFDTDYIEETLNIKMWEE